MSFISRSPASDSTANQWIIFSVFMTQSTSPRRTNTPFLSIFIDIEKAYYMVNKEFLLSKLLSYGISCRMFHFVRSFLSNRTFQDRIGSALSMTKRLENGTPQGSVLSPILFCLMINKRSPKANHLSCCPVCGWLLLLGMCLWYNPLKPAVSNCLASNLLLCCLQGNTIPNLFPCVCRTVPAFH